MGFVNLILITTRTEIEPDVVIFIVVCVVSLAPDGINIRNGMIKGEQRRYRGLLVFTDITHPIHVAVQVAGIDALVNRVTFNVGREK